MLIPRVPSSSSPRKGLYNPKAFVTHAASLDQGCPHCPRFPTAASRRSLGRVSVPVWLIILSDQLWIAALVGHYPTNKLIQRGPLPRRQAFLPQETSGISRGFPRLSQTSGQVPTRYSPVRHSHPKVCVRLACVKRAASVRSEPGSNSQLEPQTRQQSSHPTRNPGTYWPQANPPPGSKQPKPPPPNERPTRVFQKMHKPKRRLHIPSSQSTTCQKNKRPSAEPSGFPDAGTAAMNWGIAIAPTRRKRFFWPIVDCHGRTHGHRSLEHSLRQKE